MSLDYSDLTMPGPLTSAVLTQELRDLEVEGRSKFVTRKEKLAALRKVYRQRGLAPKRKSRKRSSSTKKKKKSSKKKKATTTSTPPEVGPDCKIKSKSECGRDGENDCALRGKGSKRACAARRGVRQGTTYSEPPIQTKRERAVASRIKAAAGFDCRRDEEGDRTLKAECGVTDDRCEWRKKVGCTAMAGERAKHNRMVKAAGGFTAPASRSTTDNGEGTGRRFLGSFVPGSRAAAQQRTAVRRGLPASNLTGSARRPATATTARSRALTASAGGAPSNRPFNVAEEQRAAGMARLSRANLTGSARRPTSVGAAASRLPLTASAGGAPSSNRPVDFAQEQQRAANIARLSASNLTGSARRPTAAADRRSRSLATSAARAPYSGGAFLPAARSEGRGVPPLEEAPAAAAVVNETFDIPNSPNLWAPVDTAADAPPLSFADWAAPVKEEDFFPLNETAGQQELEEARVEATLPSYREQLADVRDYYLGTGNRAAYNGSTKGDIIEEEYRLHILGAGVAPIAFAESDEEKNVEESDEEDDAAAVVAAAAAAEENRRNRAARALKKLR